MRILTVTSSILAIICSLCGDIAVSSAAAAPILPQYSLPVGRRLTYSGRSDYKYETGVSSTLSTVQLTVVSKNPDGSSRVVVRSGDRQVQTRFRDEKPASRPDQASEDVSYSQVDILPDGRVVSVAGGFSADTPEVLPPLPLSQGELHGTWKREPKFPGLTFIFHTDASPTGNEWIFKGSQEGIFKTIYGEAKEQTCHFDISRGVITSIESHENRPQTKFSQEGSMSLKSDQMLSSDQIAPFARDCAAFFTAQSTLDKAMDSVQKTPGDAKTIVAAVRAAVMSSASAVTVPEIKSQFDDLESGIDRDAKYNVEDGNRIGAMIGKPAPDFSANDLDGNPHRLSDYRGKIVVLDFWYRGCGWCMRAMPEMRHVAADFKDKPVVVLGLNTDRNADDAKFVANALDLNYTTLRIDKETSGKFNIQVVPSLIVLDTAGIIRNFDEGYSLTLRPDLEKKIQSLLDSHETMSRAGVQ